MDGERKWTNLIRYETGSHGNVVPQPAPQVQCRSIAQGKHKFCKVDKCVIVELSMSRAELKKFCRIKPVKLEEKKEGKLGTGGVVDSI